MFNTLPVGDCRLNAVDIQMHYQVMLGQATIQHNYEFPIYINIILPDHAVSIAYSIGDSSYILNKGEHIIHFLAENTTLSLKSVYNENVVLLLLIPAEKLSLFHTKYCQDPERFKNGFLTKSDPRIALNIKQIMDFHLLDNPVSQLKINSLMLDLLVHQIEVLYVESEQKSIITNKNHHEKIQLAKQLIEEDLTRSYTISELAKAVGTNEQYLKKYFKQYFGKTVLHFITDVKMEHAKQLILTGEYRISDVARLTGYKHSTHFTTAFKKYFGFIPNSLKYTFLLAQEGIQVLADITQIL